MQATAKAGQDRVESWTPIEIGVRIEYPSKVMEEIRATSSDGLHRLAHGGLEVGGVLFGERAGDSIRLVTWRPIFSEHAFGPGFRLSRFDRSELEHSIAGAKSDPELIGLSVVGWFVSHTRSGLFLTATDVEIFNEFFPESWQVALVMQPTEAGPARAGFFVREQDGTLRSETSYQEFTVEPSNSSPGSYANEPPIPFLTQRSTAYETGRERAVAKSNPSSISEPKLLSNRRPLSREAWFWATTVLLFVFLIIALSFKDRFWPSADQSFQFRAFDVGDSVRIEWDGNSALIRSAQLAVLDIKDGSETKRLALSDEQLLAGNITYAPKSEDLELQMIVFGKHSGSQQFAHLIGQRASTGQGSLKAPDAQPATPPIQAVDSTRADRNSADDQMQQLKQDLAKQTVRANQLQEVVRILQNRIAVEAARKSASYPQAGR